MFIEKESPNVVKNPNVSTSNINLINFPFEEFDLDKININTNRYSDDVACIGKTGFV